MPFRPAVVALCLCLALVGCAKAKPAKVARAKPPDLTGAVEVGRSQPLGSDVGLDAISQRNLFRPLVSPPRSEGGGGGASATGSASASGAKPAVAKGPSPVVKPPDPTADLALTGITETTTGLRALIETLSNRKGQYVAVGDMAFGFTVKSIERGAVTLAQGSKTYELRLGAKVVPEASAPPPAAPSGPPPPSSGAPSPPPSAGGSSGSGGFDWRNMTPEQREEARRRFTERMTPEQRQRFEQYRGRRGGG